MGVLDCRYIWFCFWIFYVVYIEGVSKERESRWVGNILVGFKIFILFILS